MKGLTDKQRQMLDFIESFQEKENMSPTVYEIADHFDIKTSTVFAHIRALQRKGFLVRSSKARSIALTKPRRKPKHMSFVLPIPLLGRINAGMPADNLEYKEGEVYCDPAVLGGEDLKKIFALKVHGESMRDLGILDGDVVIVKQSEHVKSGSVAVALVGGETTVKSYFPSESQVELRPANPDYKTQVYPLGQVDVQGVVIALQRQY